MIEEVVAFLLGVALTWICVIGTHRIDDSLAKKVTERYSR